MVTALQTALTSREGGTILGALLNPLTQDLVWSGPGVAGSLWPGQLLVSQMSHPGAGNWNTTEFFPSQACAMHGAEPGWSLSPPFRNVWLNKEPPQGSP